MLIATGLLIELYKRNGYSKPSDNDENNLNIYESLANYFQLTEDELNQEIYESNGTPRSKWQNMVRWARNDLLKKGLINNSKRGVWELSNLADEYLNQINKEQVLSCIFYSSKSISFEDFKLNRDKLIEIGLKGEHFVFEYEKEFLIRNGRADFLPKMEHTSLINVAAGFDLHSFSLNGDDKYIEVKTTVFESDSFEITENEWITAQKLADKYWIYRVKKINSKEPILEKIQNPANMVLNKKYIMKPTSYQMIPTE